MIKCLRGEKKLTIGPGVKIFGYASGSSETLTDYTTTSILSKTGTHWLYSIRTITGWATDSYNTEMTEFVRFFEDLYIPNKFIIYDSELANLLGFRVNTTYTKNSDNEIVSEFWGAFRLIVSGAEYGNFKSILSKCENKPQMSFNTVQTAGNGPISDYYSLYDNLIFTLESKMVHFSKNEMMKTFFEFNCVGQCQIVTPINIPKLSNAVAASGKVLRVGREDSGLTSDLYPEKDFNKFSVIVQEVNE
jgi:hypothetical protein